MSVNYREPQWLLPNEKNLQYPAAGATQGSGLTADRHSLYSMDFDGVDDIITIDTSTGVDFSNPFSVSLWAKWTAADIIDNTAGIIQFAKESQTYSFMIGTGVGTNNNTFNVSWNNNNYSFGSGYGDGNWHNIIVTGDGVNWSGVKIYIDGTNVTSSATPESGLTVNSTVTYIGQNTYSPNRQFKGLIDEVAAWSREISSDEVNNLWNSGSPSNPMLLSGKPVAYYPLGEQARKPGTANWRFPNEVLQGQVMQFTGTSEVIDVNSTIDLGTVHTISFWVNISATSFANIVTGTGGSAIKLNAPNKIYYYTNNYTNSQPSISMPLNQWNNIVIARNGSTIKFYVNESLLHTTTGFSGDSFTFNKILGLDVNNKLSNLAVWDTDQSANIDKIYNYGAPQTSYTVTPTAWYKLDKTSRFTGLNPNWHNALDFNGSSNYLTIPSTNFAGSSGEVSYSFWLNPDTYTHPSSNDYGYIFSGVDLAAGGIAISEGGSFAATNGTVSAGKVYYFDGSSVYIVTSALTENVWSNVVLVFDASGSVKGYVNGVLSISASSITTPYKSTFENIGKFYNSTHYLNGQYSNFAVFNQAISAEDVLYLYNGGTPQTNISFEPTSWWKLDNLTTGIQDSGSASVNATATDSPTEVTDSVAVNQWNFDNAVQSQTPNWSSALDFDGTSAYVTAGSTSYLNNATEMSFSVWFNLDTAAINKGIVDDQDKHFAIYTKTVSGDNYGLRVNINGSGNRFQFTGTPFTAGKWHNLLMTFNAGTLNFYIDGSSAAYTVYSGSIPSSLANNTGTLDIGRYSTLEWDGLISNAQIWTTELSAADALSIYNNGQPSATAFGSPVSWWKLDNTTIQDSAGSNNGTNNGATETQTNVWTPRLNGESDTLPSTALVSSDLQFNSAYSSFSLNFDQGSSDYINCGEVTELQNASVITWNCWVNFATANFNIVFGKGASPDAIQFYTWGSGVGYFWLKTAGTAVTASINPFIASLVNLNEWNMFTITFDGAQTGNDRLKIYLNGGSTNIITSYSATPPATLPNTTDDFYIGRGTNGYFDGKIDEFSIFNKSLNQAERTSIYNNGYPKDITALAPISWWRLGEDAYYDGTDFTIPNKISGAPNGTSNGMPATALVADAPGSYAAGLGSSLALDDRVGDAALSTANSLSFNMTPVNRVSYPAGYVPTQADNVYSMAFDGANDYISTSDIRLGNTYSISLWFNAASFPSTNPVLISQYTSGLAGRFFLGVRDDGGGRKITAFSAAHNYGSTVISTSIWYNVVLVNNNNTVTLYLNGAVDGNFTFSSAPPDTDILIGALDTTPSNPWDGNIDEVAIFDYALSARQIKQDIYEGTTSGKTADLNNISNLTPPVAWYRMGD